MLSALEILFQATNGDADYISVNNCLEAMRIYRNQGIEQAAKVCCIHMTDGFRICSESAVLALKEEV